MKILEFIKREWLHLLVVVYPFCLIALNWGTLPDQYPVHWGIDWQPDRYGGPESVFLMPAINCGVYILLLLLPLIDPRKKNYELFAGPYKIVRLIIAALFAAVFTISFFDAQNYDFNSPIVMMYLMLSLFLVLGNYMGAIRSNWFIGVRTPWTLENPEVWRKTHRLTARLWVGASLIMMLAGIALPQNVFTTLFIPYVLIIAILPIAYSYFAFRQLQKAA